MQIEIETMTKENDGTFYFEMFTPKMMAFIMLSSAGYINVICRNAAHQAYKGMGRIFWHGWDEALAAYKSADMKSMIELAKELSGTKIESC